MAYARVLEQLQDSFAPITSEEIRELEAELGVELPKAYSAFLLKHNGSCFHHMVECPLERPLDHGAYWSCGIEHFYGINTDESWSDIRAKIDVYEGRIRADLIPVAREPGGEICLAVSGEDYGKMYLWIRDDELFVVPEKNAHVVADSFAEFLDRLVPSPDRPEPEAELDIFRSVEVGDLAAVEKYLAGGGEVDCPNDAGQTLVAWAARSRWSRIVDLLLKHGAEVHTRDANGWTPLFHAAAMASIDSVKLLLAAGAEADVRDHEGLGILDHLAKYGPDRRTKILEAHGATLSETIISGEIEEDEDDLDWITEADLQKYRVPAERPTAGTRAITATEGILSDLQDSYDPTTREDIHKLEEELQLELPQQYVEFLLQFNGGILRTGLDVPFEESGEQEVLGFLGPTIFFGIDTDERKTDIRSNISKFRDSMPASLLPIGDCDGMPLCLGVSGDEHGKVYLWHHIDAEGIIGETIGLVAENFTKFFERIKPSDTSWIKLPPMRPEFVVFPDEPEIFQTVRRGDLAGIERYLADAGDVDRRNANQQTLLMCAAYYCWPKIVDLLLQHGADANARDDSGVTPLSYAATSGSVDSMKWLLAAGAQADVRDSEGCSLLSELRGRGSARRRHAKILMAHGAQL